MNDPASRKGSADGDGSGSTVRDYKRDFWRVENLNFVQPHFRLEKFARIVNKITQEKECDLLDVGCGPATLMYLLERNIHYYGIDIAIHHPAPNLIETDILDAPIKFGSRKFDVILAQGIFEYVGSFQSQKFAEIKELLKDNGTFIVSYWNFSHRNTNIYEPFNNIQSIDDFRKDLARYFDITKSFPASHNWRHNMPGRRFVKAAQMHINMNAPVISPILAVEYLFICSAHRGERDP